MKMHYTDVGLEALLQQVNVILDFIYCEFNRNFEWNVERM